MFAITVFPKRLGLVIQICEFPVSAGKNNSSSIKLLSTKYGFLTSLSYKEYGAALFKKIHIFRLLCLFLFYYQCTMASYYLQEKFTGRVTKIPSVQWFRRRTKLRRFLLCSFLSYITLKDLLQVSGS